MEGTIVRLNGTMEEGKVICEITMEGILSMIEYNKLIDSIEENYLKGNIEYKIERRDQHITFRRVNNNG